MKLLLPAFLAFAVAPSATRAAFDSWNAGGPDGFPEGVPGSGYGCDRPCGGADDPDPGTVHYTIRATIDTYDIPNTAYNENPSFQDIELKGTPLNANLPFSLHGRTFVGVPEESSRDFCRFPDGTVMDGTGGPIGPCFQFYQGDKVKVRVINDMDGGMDKLKQMRAPKDAFVNLANEWANTNLFGEAPESSADMSYDFENIPGWEASYDDTNIHFHGMAVVPHLFHPQGTPDPDAEFISIKPKSEATSDDEEDQRCYCYVFGIYDDHPQGTYLHHIHRHGSATMQLWSGMLGLVLVGDETSKGSPQNELMNQGVTRTINLVLWEFQVYNTTRIDTVNDTNTFLEGNFLPGIYLSTSKLDPTNDIYENPSQAFLPVITNNEYQPSFDDICVNETVHFRVVNGQASARSIIYVVKDPGDDKVPDWEDAIDLNVFAADGITFDEEKPYKKHVLVMAPGQRNEVLVTFNKPGRYLILNRHMSSDGPTFGIIANATTGAYAPAKIQAFIEVAPEDGSSDSCKASSTNVEELRFTPGRRTDEITNDMIVADVDLSFKQTFIRDQAPFVQFLVNGEAYDISRIGETMKVGTSSQWTLTSTQASFHPIHIHVNPFLVEEIVSNGEDVNTVVVATTSSGTRNITLMEAVSDWPLPIWRDTIQIPPNGYTVIKNKFDRFVGKTVVHCHIISHEDTGMITNLLITPAQSSSTMPPQPSTSSSSSSSSSSSTKKSIFNPLSMFTTVCTAASF